MVCGALQYLFDYVCNTSLGIESRLRLFFKLIKYFKPTLSSTKILVSSKCLGILHRELVSNLMSQRTIDFANAIAHPVSYHNLLSLRRISLRVPFIQKPIPSSATLVLSARLFR